MIVAIEAASTDLSVAIAERDGTPIADEAWTSERRQSAELLPRLLALLEREGRALGELSGLAVGTGPGSVTGLRVAMALAKGLAVALDRPIVGVPSLEAWLAAEPTATAAVARAGAREVYVLERGAEAPSVIGAEEASASYGGARVVAATELAAAIGLAASVPPRGAVAVATEAARRLATDPAGDDVQALDPVYLRPPRGLPAEAGASTPWR